MELHFELICEEWHNRGDNMLSDYFWRHRDAGMFYLEKVLDSPDKDRAVKAAYLMSEMINRHRYADADRLMREIISHLVLFSDYTEAKYRRMSIIALGWVGTEDEINLLSYHLINDNTSLCRAWSASAFLQMTCRIPDNILQAETAGVLMRCIENEQDLFTRGVAIETVQKIWKKRLVLSSGAVDSREREAIEKAGRCALKFLGGIVTP